MLQNNSGDILGCYNAPRYVLPFILLSLFISLFLLCSFLLLQEFQESTGIHLRTEPGSKPIRTRVRGLEDPKPNRCRLETDTKADRNVQPDMEPATARPRPDSPPMDRPAINEPTTGRRHVDVSPKANEHHRPRDRLTRTTADWMAGAESPEEDFSKRGEVRQKENRTRKRV